MVTPPIQMANLGMADSLILMVMALVVFGPRRLPQIGRQIGKLMYEFRKASNDFKFQMEEELRTSEEAERRQKEEERQRALVQPPTPALAPAQAVTVVTATEILPPQQPGAVEAVAPCADGAMSTSDDGVYPAVASSTADTPGEEPHLRILPPSIGEQVPAARPNAYKGPADGLTPAASEAEPSSAEAGDTEAEQAAHHG